MSGNKDFTDEQTEVLKDFASDIDNEGLWHCIDPGGHITAEKAKRVGLDQLAAHIQEFEKHGYAILDIVTPLFEEGLIEPEEPWS